MAQEQKIWVVFHGESDRQPHLINTQRQCYGLQSSNDAIKQACSNQLRLVDAKFLDVYAAGTNPDDANAEPLQPCRAPPRQLLAAASEDRREPARGRGSGIVSAVPGR